MEMLAVWVGVAAGVVVVVQSVPRGIRWLWRRFGKSFGRREGKEAVARGGVWSSRVPLFDKVVPSSGSHTGRIVTAVRSGLPIPTVLRSVDKRVSRVWRYVRRIFFTHGTTFKPIFEIEAWEYAPACRLDGSVVFEHSDGFALFVKLAVGELAGHLKYSAASLGSYGITVVVAPLESLEESQVPVYCFRVTSVGLHVDQRCRRSVMFNSERPTKSHEPTAWSVLDQAQIPPNALWLICDHGEVDLGDGWERCRTGRQMARRPAVPPNEVLINTIRRQTRREAIAKIGLWALGAIGVPLVALLVLPSTLGGRDAAVDFGAFWIVCFIFLAFVVLSRELWERIRGWIWQLQGEKAARWMGRTTWALAAGRMVRQVTLLADRKNQDLWEAAWPQHDSTETQARDPSTLDAHRLD